MRLFQRKNGFWYYELARGKRYSLKTKDKAYAKRLFNRKKREYLAGRLAELDKGSRITIADFEAKFFTKHSDIADATVAAYELAFKLLADSFGKNTLLTRINIDKFKSDCRARGVKKVSINTYLRHIRTILNKAFEWGELEKRVTINMYRLGRRLPRVLSDDELSKVLNHCWQYDFQMWRIIRFALNTGCRRAEIFGLTWQRVKHGRCSVIGKGNKERTIPLTAQAVGALGPRRDIGPVFDRSISLEQITKRFKRICRACKIEDVHFHHLRHTAATAMLASGMDIYQVKQILGHASVTTTEIYAQIQDAKLAEAMKKLRY